jgi:hypothetical protein
MDYHSSSDFAKDCHKKEFVNLITLFLIAKTLPPLSLINHITDSVFYFSDNFNYPKSISIVTYSM